MSNYYEKYLKYKQKYLELKKLKGGAYESLGNFSSIDELKAAVRSENEKLGHYPIRQLYCVPRDKTAVLQSSVYSSMNESNVAEYVREKNITDSNIGNCNFYYL